MTDRLSKLEANTRYDPSEVEQRVFAGWIEGGWFHPEPGGKPEDNFSVPIPPPNVTGSLHMGHALNGSIQDALVRLRRMQGANTMWVLGTDHAGIGTQTVVEKELRSQGISRHDLGREEFEQRVWEWRREYGPRIVEQYKRLGASCDYERERFTLDDGYVQAVHRVFKALYDKGLIYRDNYMVNWDPGMRSAISDLEVENREVEDVLYSIDYPVEDSDRVITVATVRPETMLADTAVAVHPGDERYRDLVGAHCVLPIVGRRLPVIADEHVDPEFGTGALKITPGHDLNDFEIGRRHGLDELTVIGEDGRMSADAGEEFAGMSIAEAQAAVVEALRAEGLLRAEEAYPHSVPFSHRSGERIEPLISLQWFCRMDELAEPAIEVVERDEVRIVPEQSKRVYLNWMREIRPWCVSRQLWWGHRLPVWYCDPCEETFVAEEAPERCGSCDGELRQEEDVLDTWFSSALWPFAALGWPEQDREMLDAFYPTSFLTTARDILFLWVARMVMMGLEFTGKVPFRDVYVHSVIQSPDGRRMSKSLGTGIDPLELIDEHGADALRFGLLAMSSSQDVRFSPARVEQGRDLANKLWNASRLVLLNASPAADPDTVADTFDALPAEDRWILTALQRTIAEVEADLGRFDFAHAALGFYEFFWSQFCDWYLEIVKPRLYEGEETVSAVLIHVLEQVLKVGHPMMPFVTEEIWSYMPGERGPLVVATAAKARSDLVDDGAASEVEVAIALTRRLRRWRDLAGVKAGSVLSGRADPVPMELVERLARVDFTGEGGRPVTSIGPVQILESPELDAAAVESRLAERREVLVGEVERAERKLGNEGFTGKAPSEVVEEERRKLTAYRAELEELA